MSTTLEPYQQASYSDTASLYAPTGFSQSGTGEATDPVFSTSPFLAGVVCSFHSTDEIDLPKMQGRTKEFNILTADKWFFVIDTPIHDGYCIELTTPGHVAFGRFWIVEGNPKQRPSYGVIGGNYQKVLARRAPKPAGIT